MVVQEEMSLHGLEPGQLLHPHRCPLVADPHAEASLHHHPTQLAEVALGRTDRWTDVRMSRTVKRIHRGDILIFIQFNISTARTKLKNK